MIIKIPQSLNRQEIWASGAELTGIMGKKEIGEDVLVHSFEKPVLITDNYRIAQLSPTLRDTLFSLMSSLPRIVEYDGVSVYWDSSHKSVWSPSIDTILIAKALSRVLPKNLQIESAIEIGTGSGFLSKYVLAKSTNLKSMTINDINPVAIKCAQDNIKDPRAVFVPGDGFKALEGKTFDLIVCNPPYLPRPNSVATNPYEGVTIPEYLVHEGQKHLNKGGVIVLGSSNLSDDLVFKTEPTLKFDILEEMEVPLKVNNILNNTEWLEYLKERGLKKNYHDGYEYWHSIKTILARNEEQS